MLIQHLDAKRVYLAEADGFKTACRFQPQRETTDAGEKIENCQFLAFFKGKATLFQMVYHVA